MPGHFPPITKHLAGFRSAREEAGRSGQEENWENEGGHMSATRGRIISTPGGDLPYKVILFHDGGAESARAFASMRAAEAFVRRNTPRPIARSTLWDRDAPKS